MIHKNEPTLEALIDIKKSLLGSEKTVEVEKKLKAINSQIKRHEIEAEAKKVKAEVKVEEVVEVKADESRAQSNKQRKQAKWKRGARNDRSTVQE